MKCPVCKKVCKETDKACPTCGFTELNVEFLNAEEGEQWHRAVVVPARALWNATQKMYEKALKEQRAIEKKVADLKAQYEALYTDYEALRKSFDALQPLSPKAPATKTNRKPGWNMTDPVAHPNFFTAEYYIGGTTCEVSNIICKRSGNNVDFAFLVRKTDAREGIDDTGYISFKYVDASAVFIDGTHIKASANKKKNRKVEIEVTAKAYQEQLDEEIRKDREAHGKKPLKDNGDDNDDGSESRSGNGGNANEKKTVTESITDPESGLFHKGEHEKQFAYVANTACDRHNFVLGFVLGAGNIHDSQMFSGVYQKVLARFPEIEAVAVDAGYKMPGIMKEILDSGKVPCTPYKRPMTKEGFFKKHEYVYDEYYDCILCPNNQVLKYATTNREGYREYKSDPAICSGCAMRERCTHSRECQKVVTRHVWADYMDKAEDYRYTPKYKAIYEERKQTIERVFACAKEQHGMRYTHYRGLARVRSQLPLLFASMNLKKLAIWKDRNGLLLLLCRLLIAIKGYFRIAKVPFCRRSGRY